MTFSINPFIDSIIESELKRCDYDELLLTATESEILVFYHFTHFIRRHMDVWNVFNEKMSEKIV